MYVFMGKSSSRNMAQVTCTTSQGEAIDKRNGVRSTDSIEAKPKIKTGINGRWTVETDEMGGVESKDNGVRNPVCNPVQAT